GSLILHSLPSAGKRSSETGFAHREPARESDDFSSTIVRHLVPVLPIIIVPKCVVSRSLTMAGAKRRTARRFSACHRSLACAGRSLLRLRSATPRSNIHLPPLTPQTGDRCYAVPRWDSSALLSLGVAPAPVAGGSELAGPGQEPGQARQCR